MAGARLSDVRRGLRALILVLMLCAVASWAGPAPERGRAAAAPAQTGAGETIRLHGVLTDGESGAPVGGAYVEVKDESHVFIASGAAGADGDWAFAVPRRPSYWVYTDACADEAGYRVHLYVLRPTEVLPGASTDVRADIALEPAANLILTAYDPAGRPIDLAALQRLTKGYAFATGLDDRPNSGALHQAASLAAGPGGDAGRELPAFVVPAGRPSRLHVLWAVPGFGEVLVDLDNDGQGYAAAGPGGCVTLNLNREAASSEVARLKREMTLFSAQGYPVGQAVEDDAKAARAALDDGERRLLGADPDAAAAVRCFDAALARALAGQEALYLDKARADIARWRRGAVRLALRRPDGTPLAGAAVSYRQVTHDFQFGGSYLTDGWSYLPQVADRLAEAGFNASSVMLSYKIIEPEPGRYDWSYLDRFSGLEAMLGRGFSVHGELAYWANDSAFFGDIMCPSYWRAMSFAAIQDNVREHFRALAARYGGRIGPWMINEQNLPWSNGVGLTWEQKLDIFGAVMDGLHAGDPAAQNMVNSVALPYAWSQEELLDTSAVARGISFPAYLDLLRGRGLPIDSIGLEFYHFGVTSDPYAPPGLSLASMARVLDLYDQYGVPVYVKEFEVPSTQEAGSSWWRRDWDEATQAQFAREFYTLAFSRRNARGIQWSAFVSDRNTYVKNAGLLDADYQPKPVLGALKDLIDSWTTSGGGVSDENGEVVIDGFGGDYLVYVQDGPRAIPFRVHVAEQREGRVELEAVLRVVLRVGDPQMAVGAETRPIDSQGSSPMVRDGRVLVPVRAVVEALGGTIDYDAAAGKVAIHLGEKTLELWLGRSQARRDGADTAIDAQNPAVVPVLSNGRVFLPLRFVGESLGCRVTYEAGAVTIESGG